MEGRGDFSVTKSNLMEGRGDFSVNTEVQYNRYYKLGNISTVFFT